MTGLQVAWYFFISVMAATGILTWLYLILIMLGVRPEPCLKARRHEERELDTQMNWDWQD